PRTAIVARLDGAVGAYRDRGVQGLRVVVKEIERPDVEGAAREVDARGRGTLNSHETGIIESFHVLTRRPTHRGAARHRRIRRRRPACGDPRGGTRVRPGRR